MGISLYGYTPDCMDGLLGCFQVLATVYIKVWSKVVKLFHFCFFLEVVLPITGHLCFNMNFRITLPLSTKRLLVF